MMTFNQRKQHQREARRQFRAHQHFDASLEGKIAARVHWTEFRLRGFFPSHTKVYKMIDERLHVEESRFQKLMDEVIPLLDTLAKASDDALKRGDIVSRHRMNKAIRHG